MNSSRTVNLPSESRSGSCYADGSTTLNCDVDRNFPREWKSDLSVQNALSSNSRHAAEPAGRFGESRLAVASKEQDTALAS